MVNITVFFYTIETILEELSNKKVGENTANSIFKREDFPSVNIDSYFNFISNLEI